MQETVPKNIIQQKNSDLEVLNINHFYNLFLKEKKSYAPSFFNIDKKIKRGNKRKPTLQEYKKIIFQYLKIYFHELYLLRKTMYFFLGGFMKIATYPDFINNQRRGYKKEKEICVGSKPLCLYWFMRPSKKMYYMTAIKKLTGSTNQIPKIEKIFNDNYDKDLLPTFTKEQKKGKLNKTLYRCIQT